MDDELRCNRGNNSDCEPEDCKRCKHNPDNYEDDYPDDYEDDYEDNYEDDYEWTN